MLDARIVATSTHGLALSGQFPAARVDRIDASSHRAMSLGVDRTGTEPEPMAIAVSPSVTTNSTLALRPTFTGTGLP